MTTSTYSYPQTLHGGFTLIELMVTLALAVILGSLAAPAIRDFIVRSSLTNLGNEFTGSVLKARNEAVSRNTCVTICTSSTAGDAAPACTTTGNDWQVGWIAFLNPSCDSGVNAPADAINMIIARPGTNTGYLVVAQNSTRKITFNARGAPGLGGADQYNIVYNNSSDPLNKYSFNICMDGLGRTRNIPADKNCAGFN